MLLSRGLFETCRSLMLHYDERRVRYGKTDSMGGLFNNDEGKGKKGKEADLDRLL
jgi:hypothetical protein